MNDWGEANPSKPGWYAIEYSWDSDEGTFAGYDYWDGKEWQDALPVVRTSIEPFPDMESAKKWARENDRT